MRRRPRRPTDEFVVDPVCLLALFRAVTNLLTFHAKLHLFVGGQLRARALPARLPRDLSVLG